MEKTIDPLRQAQGDTLGDTRTNHKSDLESGNGARGQLFHAQETQDRGAQLGLQLRFADDLVGID